jgi:DNA-binding transcriptional ArsR family regulator
LLIFSSFLQYIWINFISRTINIKADNIKKYNMEELLIDVDKLDCLVSRLKAILHPDRILILELLQKKEKASVGEIQAHLNLEQASTSNHLRIMKDQHILAVKRSGKNKYYSIKYAVLNELLVCINRCI